MKKILFISHDASRTGAPMVLLHFLKWLQSHCLEVQADLLVLRSGSLKNDFKKLCHNYFDLEEISNRKKFNIAQRILLKFKLIKANNYKSDFIVALSKNNYDVIYANTIVSVPFAQELVAKSTKTKFILHLHELNAVMRLMLPNFNDYVKTIDQFITPAQMVKDNLVQNWDVAAKKIAVVYECAAIEASLMQNKNREVFTIGASGTVHWRKGPDIFIQVARYLCEYYPENNFKFVWVGKLSEIEAIIVSEDLSKLGLEDKVYFIGEIENPENYYQDFDVFLMTSREDPFPLVCIELGMMGKPMISFDRAAGTNEILANGGGFIVPYLDVAAMADKVIAYAQNPALLSEHGLYNKIAFAQFTPELICPQLFAIIEQTVGFEPESN